MAVKNESNLKRKAAQAVKFCAKEERNATLKKVYSLLKKTEVDRSEEEKQFLYNYIDLVKEVTRRIDKQKQLKDRLKEVEDPPEVVAEKCVVLAEALAASTHLLVYTGAGVSTAACIPDYRGSNGIWTLLQKGKDIGKHDLSKAEPTLTHMALTELYHVGLVKYIVSQNCDGLHLRSGLPREAISEVHGNMYVEVCRQCQPVQEYWRTFDVTEYTARFSHRTGRRCYYCLGPLIDSIVHFGERGTLKWPLNWPAAVSAAARADTILCIGSSLKVLKRYPWLWGMDKSPKKRPKLYIVNLQWTPKDIYAVVKINARCDTVMEQVMAHLRIQIPCYQRSHDPIFWHATHLHPDEQHTTARPLLEAPEYSQDALLGPGALGKSSCYNQVNVDQEKSKSREKLEEQINLQCVKVKSEEDENTSAANGKVVVYSEAKKQIKPESSEELQEERSTSSKDDLSSFPALDSNEAALQIIYEGVKLKVEDNLSVPANVKIKNDLAILCDMSSVTCNSFLLNSSYKLEELEGSVHQLTSGSTDGSGEALADHNSRNCSASPTAATTSLCTQTVHPSTLGGDLTPSRASPKQSQSQSQSQSATQPAKCEYCAAQHNATKCLFYSRHSPVFRKATVHVCECCSGDSSSADEDTENKGDVSDDKDTRECHSAAVSPAKPSTNPGWYGRGYRKRVKKKR